MAESNLVGSPLTKGATVLMLVVLDTSAVSAVMHRNADALDRLKLIRPAEVVLSTPVAAEIQYGLERLQERSRRRKLLTEEYNRLRKVVRWEDWTESAAHEFGTLKARLAKAGTPLEDFDIAIASVALALEARLATLNAKHFSRIAGLAVDDWLSLP